MILTCWGCGGRINERTVNSDLELFTTDVKPEDIGKHVLFEHRPFHDNDYCIGLFLRNKQNG